MWKKKIKIKLQSTVWKILVQSISLADWLVITGFCHFLFWFISLIFFRENNAYSVVHVYVSIMFYAFVWIDFYQKNKKVRAKWKQRSTTQKDKGDKLIFFVLFFVFYGKLQTIQSFRMYFYFASIVWIIVKQKLNSHNFNWERKRKTIAYQL